MRDENLDKGRRGMPGKACGHREDWREPEFPLADAADTDADEIEDHRSEELR